MAHRHSHHAGGMLMLDTLAANSGLRDVSPGLKTAFSVLVLLLCVSASDALVGIFVALTMVLIMGFLGKTPVKHISELLKIPLLFLGVSTLVILLEILREPAGLWQLRLGNHWLCVTGDSLHRAVTLFFQAMGAVCCLYFLSSTTPMPQIIEVLRRCHVPELVIELMYLIYRYLFVLLEVQRQLTISASARLGYAGIRRSIATAGRVSGALLAASFRRSRACFDAMESRGYDGKLNFLSHAPRLRWGHLLAACVYVLALLGLIFMRKGWPCL